ncbi:hypothetical protein BB559_001721 [Furculomyces boomerangus]|uniref:KOW domain-containing protein n=2 Tax=Harpellales TaxID=61421 RepID=A0A2T9Z0Z0_9FUNG|nr:hypothetical protein BB559_001721 [Furculomyces boomerangus]PVZ96531.1 hypothetical protein BB558_007569 [Smittium angustum]
MPTIHKSILKRLNPRVTRLVKPLPENNIIKSWKIVRGDEVMVISGKDKGKKGRVVEVIRDHNSVKVTNLNIAKKSVPKSDSTPSGIILKEMPIHVSNVALIDPTDGMPTKIKLRKYVDPETGKSERRRYAIGTGTYIPKPKYLEYQTSWADGDKDTLPEEVSKVTYFPKSRERPMPSEILREVANRRRELI